ncbi:MAG: organic hydroperoxide resistance protein [Bdellovibrionales bacterium]|nr:organic hydroperoxide resistance protein [Bdellovibrionales bacterium]
MKTLYTTKVTTSGGRDGKAESADGRLKVSLSMPKELGGAGAPGATNPEQLFAAGYSACFESAIRHIGRNKKVTIPELSVDCEVSLLPAPTGFALRVSLHPKFSGLDQKVCEDLVSEAHKICPYSNATRNNIEVKITVN